MFTLSRNRFLTINGQYIYKLVGMFIECLFYFLINVKSIEDYNCLQCFNLLISIYFAPAPQENRNIMFFYYITFLLFHVK